MDLPKYHETFIPILKTLKNKNSIHRNDLKIRVRDAYYSNLSQDLLDQVTSRGESLLFDRIGWGQFFLDRGKFVHRPERGRVQITDKGLERLEKGKSLSLKDLQNDPDYLAYESSRKKSNTNSAVKPLPLPNDSPQDLIDSGFEAIEKQVKMDLLERVKNINPYDFEITIGTLLKKMGYGDFKKNSQIW